MRQVLAALQGRAGTVVSLGVAQTLAWAFTYYLPAMLAAPMAHDLGVSTPFVFGAFYIALLVAAHVGPKAGSAMKAVVYDFAPSRAGEHARAFLRRDDGVAWQGQLVCDDYAGYKASFTQGIVEVGCAAHARRKFFELHASTQSATAAKALVFFGELYAIEREVRGLDANQRTAVSQERARPVAEGLHTRLLAQRMRATDGTALARALDYSLKRWAALTRYLDDGHLPIDNNWVENQIRPIALGRANWLFAGSFRAGQRAAAVMSLVQSARLNRLDPYAYLRDVLVRLPTQPASRIEDASAPPLGQCTC